MTFLTQTMAWLPRTETEVPTAYEHFLEVQGGGPKGFPRTLQVHEWVPGVSTPEGVLLVSAAALLPGLAMNSHVMDTVITAAANTMMLAVTAAPMVTVFAGYSITKGR